MPFRRPAILLSCVILTSGPALFGADLLAAIAGGGTQAPVNGIPATDAVLRIPRGIAADGAGNLYFADVGGVRKIDSGGILSTVVGVAAGPGTGDGGPAGAATLNAPIAVATDGAGNLYIADAGDFRVRKVDASGTISTAAGSGKSGNSGDGGPAGAATLSALGVALDSAGNLYVLSSARVRKIDSSGTITTVAGGGTSRDENVPAVSAQITPNNLAVDAAGNIFIDDALPALLDNGSTTDFPVRLRRVDAKTGNIATLAGGGTSAAADPSLVPALSSTVHQFSRDGLVLDAAGNLYFAEYTAGNTRIRILDSAYKTISLFVRTAGTSTTEYAGDGSTSTVQTVGNITGIGIDRNANIYIASSDGAAVNGSGLIMKVTRAAGSGSTAALSVQKTLLKLNFASPGADSLNVSGMLSLPANFKPEGKTVQIFAGTTMVTFVLNSKGKFTDPATSFSLSGKIKNGVFISQNAKLTLTLKKQQLAAGLSGLGFSNADVPRPGTQLHLPLFVDIDTVGYQANIAVLYTAKAGKSGTAK